MTTFFKKIQQKKMQKKLNTNLRALECNLKAKFCRSYTANLISQVCDSFFQKNSTKKCKKMSIYPHVFSKQKKYKF